MVTYRNPNRDSAMALVIGGRTVVTEARFLSQAI